MWRSPIARRTGALAVAAIGLAALLLHAQSYCPFFADDAFISMRYAERLLAGKGLTWTDGERVEGYSNLLWVLLLAAARTLSPDLIAGARLLGQACMGAALLGIVRAHHGRRARGLLAGLFGVLLVALAGPAAAWTIGGLEPPLVAACLAWGLALALPLTEGSSRAPRRALAAGAPFALLVLARSDGAFLVAATGLGLVLARRFEPRSFVLTAHLVALPVAAWLAQLGARLAYYGDYVPNTAHAKVAFRIERLESGWRYLSDNGWLESAPAIVAAAALLALAVPSRRRGRLVLGLTVFVAWAAYVVSVGGDNMPQRRHLVPLVIVGALLGAELLWRLLRRRWIAPLGLAAAVLCLAHLVVSQEDDFHRQRFGAGAPWPLKDCSHERASGWMWDGLDTGELFRVAFAREQPLVAVDAAGVLPYVSRLPCLDMLGLNDRYLATHPPATFGTGWVGHELGDGAYVFRREPDLILFGSHVGSSRGTWTGGRQLFAMPEFHRRYRAVILEARTGVRATVFARVDGGRTGIRREADRVFVPGFLFGSASTPARLDRHDRLGVDLAAGTSAQLPFALEAGTYRVRVRGGAGWSVRGAAREGDLLEAPGGTITLTLTAGEARAHVPGIELVREP